jgi:phosphate starvation-inducible PhoH-like protein
VHFRELKDEYAHVIFSRFGEPRFVTGVQSVLEFTVATCIYPGDEIQSDVLAEKKISIEGVNPLLIFGFNDSHLRRIEASFPDTSIVARGNQIVLRGPEEDLSRIERTISELILILNRNKNLTDNDVITVLDLVSLRSSVGPVDQSEVILFGPEGRVVKARTPGQIEMVTQARQNDIVFAVGPAGTGKTYTAVGLAVAAMKSRQVKRIVLSRPAVEAGESLGFLPGDLREKVDPYLRPLYDALEDMLPREQLRSYMEQGIVEIGPLAYMRGRTLHSAFAILDEAQNTTAMQMKMFLTRLGPNSRAIITGDITQIDLPHRSTSGLVQAQRILERVEGISFCYLDQTDVVRHQLVRDIISAYDDYFTAPEPLTGSNGAPGNLETNPRSDEVEDVEE